MTGNLSSLRKQLTASSTDRVGARRVTGCSATNTGPVDGNLV